MNETGQSVAGESDLINHKYDYEKNGSTRSPINN